MKSSLAFRIQTRSGIEGSFCSIVCSILGEVRYINLCPCLVFWQVSKRVLESYTVQGVKEVNQQTLTGTSIVASNGETDMTFVKSLDEPGEIVIDATGINTLVFAVGSSGTLGFHSLFFIENVNLASCESSTVHTDSMNPDAVRIHAILMICQSISMIVFLAHP